MYSEKEVQHIIAATDATIYNATYDETRGKLNRETWSAMFHDCGREMWIATGRPGMTVGIERGTMIAIEQALALAVEEVLE